MSIIRHHLHGMRTAIPGLRKLFDCGVRVVGKPPDPHKLNDLEFAAEHVCMELARAIRLPAAHGVMAVDGKEDWYCSFNFNVAQPQLLPPRFGTVGVTPPNRANARKFVKKLPQLACGIVAFDIWTCNPDRHDKNLAYYEGNNVAFIYDHGMSLLRSPDPKNWLDSRRNSLSIENSCIAPVLDDLTDILEWADRIRSIPEFFIREVLHDATQLGLSPTDADFCVDFLLDRRDRLLDLINDNATSFPQAPLLLKLQWPTPLPLEFGGGEGI